MVLMRCLTYMWTQGLFALMPVFPIDCTQVSKPRSLIQTNKVQPLLAKICVSPSIFPQMRRVTSPLPKLSNCRGCQISWKSHSLGWERVPLRT